MAENSFHLFPRLPTELRLEIWRLCLPNRVWELDIPTAEGLFGNRAKGSYPCNVQCTARLNGLPPVITRVCQESRDVAHESAGIVLEDPDEDPPDDACWATDTTDSFADDFWIDLKRGSAHINWNPLYVDFYERSCGSALACIAWESRKLVGQPSIMKEWFTSSCDREEERFDVLDQLPNWRVVMRVVIIHATFWEAAQSGLFGLLGDAPVQIVSVSNEEKVNNLYDFADKHRQTPSVEEFQRVPSEVLKQELKDSILTAMGSEKLLSKLYPTIMFRLCTSRCNRPVK